MFGDVEGADQPERLRLAAPQESQQIRFMRLDAVRPRRFRHRVIGIDPDDGPAMVGDHAQPFAATRPEIEGPAPAFALGFDQLD